MTDRCIVRVNIRKRRSSVVWIGRATMPDGSRVERALGDVETVSRRAAEIAARRFELELNDRPQRPGGIPMLSDWIEGYWSLASAKPSTRANYEWSWRLLREAVGDTPLDRVTPEDAARFVRALERDGVPTATIRTHTRQCRVLFSLAAKLGTIDRNPFEGLRTDVPRRSRVGADRQRWYQVTRAELAELEGASDLPGWVPMLRLTRFAGLRRAEAIALRVQDIRERDNVLDVWLRDGDEAGTKQGEREVPLAPEVREIVGGAPSAFVVSRRIRGGLVGAERIARVLTTEIRRASADLGLDLGRKPWHTLRDSCVNEWHQTPGISPATAAAWSGHSLTVYMARYAEIGRAEVERVAGGAVSDRARLRGMIDELDDGEAKRVLCLVESTRADAKGQRPTASAFPSRRG